MGNEQIARLHRMARTIGFFWMAVTLAMLLVDTAFIFAQRPWLLSQAKGWAILAGALAFGMWYLFGWRWMTPGDGDAHYARLARGLIRLAPRPLAYWAALLLLCIGLSALDENFRFMLFPVYGIGMTIISMPWAVLPTATTVLIIFAEFHWLPKAQTPDEWLSFVLNVLAWGVYTATAYLPFILLTGRFDRERVHAELEQSHRELEEAHRQLADAAERERELAVLRERERLARDLHDTIGHALVLASVKLEAALRLRGVDPARADHEIAATQSVLRGTMTELRATLANLRAPDQRPEPLAQALSTRAEEAARRAGWRLTLALDDDLGDLDARVYEALARVGTEALANAEKHAAASAATVSLGREGDAIVLRVADDGKGIAGVRVEQPALVRAYGSQMAAPDSPARGVTSSPPGHYGITGMRERAESVGGTLAITSGPDGRGTIVEARMPVGGR